MDGLGILFVVLVLVFLGMLFAMNMLNYSYVPREKHMKEGFDSPSKSPVEKEIRAALDPMILPATPDVCDIFTTLRETMAKNIKAETSMSDAEVSAKVEATLAENIPGGALPCPLLTYPVSGSDDLTWLNFLNSIPPDFGARIVLMMKYAKKELKHLERALKAGLSGKEPPTPLEEAILDKEESAEGFEVCPPTVADTRRAAASAAAVASATAATTCQLPEEMTPEEIKVSVTALLQNIKSQKISILTAKNIDPNIDIAPLISSAKASKIYLEKKAKQAKDGTLVMDTPGLVPTGVSEMPIVP